TLTQARYEDLNFDLFRRTLKPVEKVLKDADMTKGQIHEFVLVAGFTRIQKVQKLV
ncbi:HSP 70, partial [Gracilaria domingensis]